MTSYQFLRSDKSTTASSHAIRVVRNVTYMMFFFSKAGLCNVYSVIRLFSTIKLVSYNICERQLLLIICLQVLQNELLHL